MAELIDIKRENNQEKWAEVNKTELQRLSMILDSQSFSSLQKKVQVLAQQLNTQLQQRGYEYTNAGKTLKPLSTEGQSLLIQAREMNYEYSRSLIRLSEKLFSWMTAVSEGWKIKIMPFSEAEKIKNKGNQSVEEQRRKDAAVAQETARAIAELNPGFSNRGGESIQTAKNDSVYGAPLPGTNIRGNSRFFDPNNREWALRDATK